MSTNFIVTVALVAVTLAVFLPACRYDFVGWDDDINVYANPYLSPPALRNTLHFWKVPHEGLYIPATYSVWALVAALSRGGEAGFDPRIFHGVNVVVHILNVLLVYAILTGLFRSAARDRPGAAALAAGAGALLFALHPVQVEPVVWVTSMKDLLCGLFSLLSLLFYLSFARGGAPGNRRRPSACLATAFFVLALLSKPSAVAIPLVAWLLLLFRDSGSRSGRTAGTPLFRRAHLLPAAWLLLSLLFVAVTRYAAGKSVPDSVGPLWTRLLVAGDALGFYLLNLFFPLRLGIDYGRTPEFVLETARHHFLWLIPCTAALALCLPKGRRQWLAALGIFVAGALPTLGLVPHAYQVFSTVADRYLYLALLGPALALGWYFLSLRSVTLRALCIVILCLLGIRSGHQRRYWSDNETLFGRALEINERSYMAHYNLGLTLDDRGMTGEASAHYREALAINPDYSRAHNNLGAALVRQGKMDQAIDHFAEAFRLDPGNRRARFNLYSAHNAAGVARAGRGDIDGAVFHYLEALRVEPGLADAHSNLGSALANRGRLDEAVAHCLEAIRLKPDFAMAHNNLGAALARQGKLDEARARFSEALRLDPDCAQARANLGRLSK